MKYTIIGNGADGYVIAGSDGKTNYNACPCCLKPITTFRRATLIAQGLVQDPQGAAEDLQALLQRMKIK